VKTPARVQEFWQRWRDRIIAFELRLLALVARLVPTERQRVFLLTLLLGALCGLAAVGFHLAILAAEHLLIEQALHAPGNSWMFWTILTPTLGSLIAGILLQYVVPDARGSGIPQVKVAYAVKGGHLPFGIALGKFGLGVLQLGTGASLGREGPTAQICASIASGIGRSAALSRRNQQRMLPVGVAAGIAAAFNAPIAAVTFTIEEVVGNIDQAVLAGVIVAAAVAAAVEHSILGEQPILSVPRGYGLDNPASLLIYALLGVAAALVSILFTDALLHLRRRFQRMRRVPPWARPAIGGLITGVLAVVALAYLGTTGITGGGYEVLGEALHGEVALQVLLALMTMKIVATVFAYSSGNAGGIFAPSLFIGGMLGGLFGYLDMLLLGSSESAIGTFALVGMGAVFAGIIRAPITSVLIIFEMTGGYGLILPLMIANMTTYVLARRFRPTPIYEALLEQDGIQLPHARGRPRRHGLEMISVGEVMMTRLVTLDADATARQALERIRLLPYSSYPVIDSDHSFVGLVSAARLRRTQAEGRGTDPLRLLADRRTGLLADEPLLNAVILMDEQETHQLAVVQRSEGEVRLRGMITMSDIVRAQARLARDEDHESPPLSEAHDTLDERSVLDRLRAFGPVQANGSIGSSGLCYHETVIEAASPAAGRLVRALHLPEGVLLAAIGREERLLIPQGDTEILSGDRVTLLAPASRMAEALQVLHGDLEASAEQIECL
jgi:CIC family chloride channel protein